MDIIPISLRATSSFLIFLVPQAPKGVAITPAIAKIIASVKSINPFNKKYIKNPATEIINSEAVVVPIDSFVSKNTNNPHLSPRKFKFFSYGVK